MTASESSVPVPGQNKISMLSCLRYIHVQCKFEMKSGINIVQVWLLQETSSLICNANLKSCIMNIKGNIRKSCNLKLLWRKFFLEWCKQEQFKITAQCKRFFSIRVKIVECLHQFLTGDQKENLCSESLEQGSCPSATLLTSMAEV